MASQDTNRAYSAAHFALMLDGKKDAGLVKSVEGGNVKTDMIKYQTGRQHETLLRLGKPKYDDIKIQVGAAMSSGFYDWMKSLFTGEAIRKTGAILAADFTYTERARRDFDQAMVTELQFPKLDGNDKGPCYLGVTISPEILTYKPGDGTKLQAIEQHEKQKLWAACNFSFSIDGFESSCRRVTKVDSFTIKQKAIEYHQGGMRGPIKVPGKVEFPNLAFYVPEADGKAFFDHHVKHTLEGKIQADARLSGHITTHDNAGAEVFRIDFEGADIFAVTHDKGDASSEEIKQVKVELCVEKMSFDYGT